MAKICLVGAGSTVFAQNILGDVLSNPELADSEVQLFDIDAERLSTSEIMARRIGETLGLANLRVTATTNRRAALKGADFVILMMQIGGASLSRIFFTIYLPLSKPALAAFAIFAFLFSWNDLFSALIYLPADAQKTTLTVGLALFQVQFRGQWTLMMAASLVSAAPIIIAFFLAQKHFVRGVAMTGFK